MFNQSHIRHIRVFSHHRFLIDFRFFSHVGFFLFNYITLWKIYALGRVYFVCFPQTETAIVIIIRLKDTNSLYLGKGVAGRGNVVRIKYILISAFATINYYTAYRQEIVCPLFLCPVKYQIYGKTFRGVTVHSHQVNRQTKDTITHLCFCESYVFILYTSRVRINI